MLKVGRGVAVTPVAANVRQPSQALSTWEISPTSCVDVRVSVELETVFTHSVEEQIRSQVHLALAKLIRLL